MFRLSVIVWTAVLLGFSGLTRADNEQQPVLVKIISTEKKVIVGQWLRETDDNYEILDLSTGKQIAFPKTRVDNIRKPISELEASNTVGLPNIVAWHIVKLVPRINPTGKIARLDGGIVYVTLGEKTGITKGYELRVVRGQSEVKDPVTGAVLGTERRIVAKLIVVEVFDKYAKARVKGDLEPELLVGDTVEPTTDVNLLAVFPFSSTDGNETPMAGEFSNRLTTSLSKWGMTLVERSQLGKVIAELALQDTSLFDAEKAQRLGKLLGAQTVVVGTATTDEGVANVSVRLVEVTSGKILFSDDYRMRNWRGKSIEPGQGRTPTARKGAVSRPAGDGYEGPAPHEEPNTSSPGRLPTSPNGKEPSIEVTSASFGSKQRTEIKINGQEMRPNGGEIGRGLYVVAIVDKKVVLNQVFDCLGYIVAANQFADAINNLPNGAVVIVAVNDEATQNFNRRAQQAILSIGGHIGLFEKPFRSAYYCVGKKGFKEGLAAEAIGQKDVHYSTLTGEGESTGEKAPISADCRDSRRGDSPRQMECVWCWRLSCYLDISKERCYFIDCWVQARNMDTGEIGRPHRVGKASVGYLQSPPRCQIYDGRQLVR